MTEPFQDCIGSLSKQSMTRSTDRTRVDRRTFLRTGVGLAGGVLGGRMLSKPGAAHGGHVVNVTTINGEVAMQPVGLYVPHVGDRVVFAVDSDHQGGPHTSTADEDRIPAGTAAWDSGPMEAGDTYGVTFTAPGTYDYHCAEHREGGHVGRIVVEEPGGPAEESPIPEKPPTGSLPPGDRIVAGERILYPFEDEDADDDLRPTHLVGFGLGGAVIAGVAGYLYRQRRGSPAGNDTLR